MNHATGPFFVAIAIFAMVLGIVIVVNVANYYVRKLKSEERMTAIAKGLPLPPDFDGTHGDHTFTGGARTAAGIRTGGIICIFTGIGLALFSFFLAWIVGNHHVLAIAAAGLIPLAIGVGLLVDHSLRTRSARAEANQSSGVHA